MEGKIDSVLKQVVDQKIHFVQLWFTDLLGNLKSIEIPSSELHNALEQGVGFDGSSIHGFARIDESDMLAVPDPSTFVVLPWDNVGRLICDIQLPGGESPTKAILAGFSNERLTALRTTVSP